MSVDVGQGRTAQVAFTGTRTGLFGILLRGYILMVPTIGIYRFWVTTWKRRFYWHNTVIDGDPLEYDGNALQLLIGFLFAIAFFLPVYIAFFYLSTQSPDIAIVGYIVVGAVLWFLSGYAIYRARDFRLSRTLWRGIRFNQHGSAWAYAARRFLWTIAMALTAGLVYPAMASSLWRYRYNNTWYGDRQFRWTGSWKTIAGPYYLSYFLIIVAVVGAVVAMAASSPVYVEGALIPGPGGWLGMLAAAVAVFLCWLYFRSREATRMFSAIEVGAARVAVKVRTRGLLGQFLIYALALAGTLLVLLTTGWLIVAGLVGDEVGSLFEMLRVTQSSWLTILALVFGYLLVVGTFALFGEVFLGFGYWMLVARGATIAGIDSLRSVRASGEDQSLAGEGLADALNVGSY